MVQQTNTVHKRFVPTLEKCKYIPNDSSLQYSEHVWWVYPKTGVSDVVLRDDVDALKEFEPNGLIYPAPTFEEILCELPEVFDNGGKDPNSILKITCEKVGYADPKNHFFLEDLTFRNRNGLADTALALFFKVKYEEEIPDEGIFKDCLCKKWGGWR